MRLIRRRLLCWPGAFALTIVVAAPAHGAVTASQISNPADPKFMLYDASRTLAHPATLAISGKASGTGTVDIVCVTGTAVTPLGGTASNVALAPDGTFSVVNAPLAALVTGGTLGESPPCRLHAVPPGSTGPFDAFTGPRLALTKYAEERVAGGINDGALDDFYVYAAGLGYSADYTSFGDCGVYDSNVQDPIGFGTLSNALYCNGYVPTHPAMPFYGVQVDGQAAYPPYQAAHLGVGSLQANPGFPALRVDPVQLDTSTGDVTMSETDPFARCAPDNAYPPTPLSCTSFTAVPVTLARTTQHTRFGQVIRVVDHWSSTDAHAHSLDLTLGEDTCFAPPGPCSVHVAYRFPGQSAYAERDGDPATPEPGDVAGPLPATEPIMAKEAHDPSVGGTGIVPAQASDGARFFASSQFGLQYLNRTIPATGELTLAHYYVTGRTPDEAERLAADVKASLQPPPPAPPGGGAVITSKPRPKLSRRGAPRVTRRGATFVVTTGDRVACPAGGAACVVTVRASVRVPAWLAKLKRVTVASTTIRVPAGRTKPVRFRLNAKGARALKRLHRLTLSVTLSARKGSGAPVRRTRSVRIAAPKR